MVSSMDKNRSIMHGWRYTLHSIIEIHRMFEDILKEMGDCIYSKTAMVFDGNKTVFAELNQKANRLARILYKKIKYIVIGNTPTIAVFMYPSDNLIITLLAILKLGVGYLPLDITSSKSFIAFILHQSKPLCIIVDSESYSSLKSYEDVLHISIPIHEYEQLMNFSFNVTFENLKEHEMISDKSMLPGLACVLYTSINSGLPKRVLIYHKTITNHLIWFIKTFPLITDELGCFKTPLTCVDSILEIFGSLLQKNGLLIIHKYVAQNLLLLRQVLIKYDVSQLFIIPSVLREILKDLSASGENNNSLRKIKVYISGGETFPSDLLQQFFNFFPFGYTLANRLVVTKITGSVTCEIFRSCYDVKDYINKNVSIGVPIFNTNIYLLDKNFQMVPRGKIGEICVSGLNISHEYLSINETNCLQNYLDQSEGHEMIYRTGDYGCIVNGNLIFEGSMVSKIMVQGQRVYLNEIERVINNINGVEKSVVLCFQPGESSQTLIAYYVKKKTTNITDQDLIFQMGNYLPPYMIPNIEHVENIPLMIDGQTDRQSLYIRYEEKLKNPSIPTNYSLGNDFIQIVLMAVSAVLGFSKSNPILSNSNFFEIGGNSLNCIQTIWTLKQHGFEISIVDFVESKSLREVADKLTFITPDMKQQITGLKSNYSNYLILPLKEIDCDEAIELVSVSFVTKGELLKYTNSKFNECHVFLRQFWDQLRNDGYSFGVTSENQLLGISLNFDINGQYINIVVPPLIEDTYRFLQAIEKPICDKLPKERGKILQNFIVARKLDLTPQENIMLINLMEEENLKLAQASGFQAMMTTHTNALTHQIRHTLFDYKIYQRVQLNQYVDAAGKKPFGNAPDELIAYITLKTI